MTAEARAAAAVTTPSTLSRIYGLGSVFGKTLRDSRRATIAVGGFIGLLLLVVSQAITSQFATPESRQQIGDLVDAVPPIMQGMAGRPVNVESLGGYIQYKYGGFFPLVTALWSILALSGTLAAEVRRGSMEIVAASALTRRRTAIQKLVGHVLVMTIAMAVTFLATRSGSV